MYSNYYFAFVIFFEITLPLYLVTILIPFTIAIIMAVGFGAMGDRYRIRGPIVLFNYLLQIVGLVLVGFGDSRAVGLAGYFLTVASSYANFATCLAYQANNVRGRSKRVFMSAMVAGAVAMGGMIGAVFVYDEMSFSNSDINNGIESDQYYYDDVDYGYEDRIELTNDIFESNLFARIITCLVCTALSILAVIGLMIKFRVDNARQMRGEKVIEGSEVSLFAYLGVVSLSSSLELIRGF